VPSDQRRSRQDRNDGEYRFAQDTGVRGIAFYRGELIDLLRESLLVASDAGLMRVTLDPRRGDRVVSMTPLIDGQFHAVAQDHEGRLYAATPSAVLSISAATRK
jgi:glucose/arabinose dehydrogenase